MRGLLFALKAEEDAIKAALAKGQRDLSQIIQTPQQVAESNSLAGLFAQAFGQQPQLMPEVAPAYTDDTQSHFGDLGLYANQVDFLADALQTAFIAPADPPEKGGVGWRYDQNFGLAELVPPRDLMQRLGALPQTYLKDRDVKSSLKLATTAQLGQARLKAALADKSDSSWPDAHFLSPLHPVLDWAADRALASLRRGEVYAVRGKVTFPTVLVMGTLTNKAGRVVAVSWMTVEAPRLGQSRIGRPLRFLPAAQAAGARSGKSLQRQTHLLLNPLSHDCPHNARHALACAAAPGHR